MDNQTKRKLILKRKNYARKRQRNLDVLKKEERISLRIAASEKRAIEKRAKELGMNLTDYIISCSLNNVVLSIDFKELEEYSRQLASYGNSLNQITRVLNEARYYENINDKTVDDAAKELEKLTRLYQELLESLESKYKHISAIKNTQLFEFDVLDQ
jgi:Bacterial mobilisation protein (MobC).